ncbi:MAG TPA: DNA recombination protein RmuC [Candidatus Kaiserbacteria bacterium]|nr:DNA recombination protein RmuC [Candidatus Kaiserbacteria bacterium]
MDFTALAFLIFIVVVLNALVLWVISKNNNKNTEKDLGASDGILLIQKDLQELRSTMDRKMSESAQTMHDSVKTQLGESSRIVKEVTEQLTKLDETNKQVISVTDQLQGLQDILKNPKQRGVLGEYYLEALLRNVLPPSNYQMQYTFKNGEIVDAVVFVKDKIIPVDSKFSLENYNRLAEAHDPAEKERLGKVFSNDLKLRIQETSKYIRPEEGTMDFAFMFIPHEAIYYDLLVGTAGMATADSENLIQRAAGKYKVIIVSPTSFLAYLQTVLQGLKAMQIEETAKDIIKRVGELGQHLSKYDLFMSKLGNSLGTTVNSYNTAYKELKKVDKDVLRISESSPGIEVLEVKKPDKED